MSNTQEHKPRGDLQEGFTLMEIVRSEEHTSELQSQ